MRNSGKKNQWTFNFMKRLLNLLHVPLLCVWTKITANPFISVTIQVTIFEIKIPLQS